MLVRQNRNRFWYIEDVELQALFPLFMNWAKTMGSSLRQELASTGLALHENRMDEVSRSIQYVAAFLCSPLLSLAFLCFAREGRLVQVFCDRISVAFQRLSCAIAAVAV